MSLSKSDLIETGRVKQKKFGIELTYERDNVTDPYEELIEGQRYFLLEVFPGNKRFFTNLMYVPRKDGKLGMHIKLLTKNPYGVLNTPRFSLLWNL